MSGFSNPRFSSLVSGLCVVFEMKLEIVLEPVFFNSKGRGRLSTSISSSNHTFHFQLTLVIFQFAIVFPVLMLICFGFAVVFCTSWPPHISVKAY